MQHYTSLSWVLLIGQTIPQPLLECLGSGFRDRHGALSQCSDKQSLTRVAFHTGQMTYPGAETTVVDELKSMHK